MNKGKNYKFTTSREEYGRQVLLKFNPVTAIFRALTKLVTSDPYKAQRAQLKEHLGSEAESTFNKLKADKENFPGNLFEVLAGLNGVNDLLNDESNNNNLGRLENSSI